MLLHKESSRLQTRKLAPKIEAMLEVISANIENDIDLQRLAAWAHCDKQMLERWFRKRYQISPIRWLWGMRISVAARVLQNAHGYTLTDIAFACGFKSSAHFTRLFRTLTGFSPSEFRSSLPKTVVKHRPSRTIDISKEVQLVTLQVLRDNRGGWQYCGGTSNTIKTTQSPTF